MAAHSCVTNATHHLRIIIMVSHPVVAVLGFSIVLLERFESLFLSQLFYDSFFLFPCTCSRVLFKISLVTIDGEAGICKESIAVT